MRSTVPHNNFALQSLAKAWLVLLLIVGLVSQLKAQNDSQRGERNSVFVDAPLLQSPADNAKNISINPTFTWSSARGAESYTIEVATSSDLSNDGSFKRGIVASAPGITGKTNWDGATLSPDKLYYWHVSADSGSGGRKITAWSGTFSFTAASLPSVPALSSPSNGAMGVSTSPTLSWRRSTNADSYVVKYFTGSSIVDNIVSDTSFTATGLTKSTTYTWQVRASGPGGPSAFSGEWTFKTGGGAPEAPTLTAPPNGATGVSINPTLSWNPVIGATSYSVDVSKNSSFSQIVVSVGSHDSTSFSVSGLEYSTQYYWRVKAANADGVSNPSGASFTTQSAKPNPPQIISPSDGAKDVPISGRLDWSGVSGTGTTWEIQVDTDNQFKKPTIDATTTSAFYQYSGLLNAQVYFWRVRVTTAGGTSEWSSKVSFTTVAAKIAAPTPQFPANGATNVPLNATLTWSSISGATYDVEISDTISLSRIVDSNKGLRNNTFITNTLANNKTYYWHVKALTSSSASDWSTIFNFTTETGKLPAPELILPANNAQNQSTELSLNWKLVPGALSYGVEIATDQNFKKDVTVFTGISTASYSLQGLSPNTTYYWHVYAANAHGPGAWSEAWNFTTASSTLAAPTLKDPTDRKKDVPTTPILQWDRVPNATSYTVQVSTSSKFEAGTIFVDQSGVIGTIFQTQTLLNKTTYYWRVKATGPTGSSDWSSVWEFTTIASKLLPPLLVSPGDGQVLTTTSPELAWFTVGGALSYSLQYSTDRNFRNDVIEISGISSTLYKLHGLLPTTTYYWHVQAKDSLNTSDWSNSRSFTTGSGLVAPPKLIDPIDNATGVSLNAVLSWSISPGAKTYGVQVSEDKGFKNIVFDTSGVQKTSLVVRNLEKQKTYYWHVNAADSTGAGSYSDYWSFKTGSGQLSAPLLSSPLDGAQAVSVRPLLTWNPVIGAKTYTLQISDDRRLSKNVFEEDSIRTTSFGAPFELSPNTTYYWQVRASDSLIASDWSGIWEFTTGSGRLSAPTLLYPPDKTDNVPVNFTLSWGNIVGAVSYGVQIATDSKFQVIVFQDSVKTTTLDITGFSTNTKYYWHVNAVDSSGKKSDWSNAWMFTTGTSLLAAPQLVFPSNGTIGTSINPRLEWTVIKGATTYNLQYATDKNFRKDLVEVDGIAGASYQINIPFLVNTTYYWRVQSKADSATLSAWSDYWSFITGNGILATPVLRSPDDGAEVSTSLILKWDGTDGAKMYALQVSDGNNFNKLIVDEPNLVAAPTTTNEYPLNGLETKKTYYWRVRAIKDNETSDWTPTWKFKTSVPTGVEITESSVSSLFRLSQNFPNPFNPSTTIEFSIPKSSDVKIMIYNILGNLVHTLVDQRLSAGTYRTQWNASGLASGVYLYRIQAGAFIETKRLILIK